MKYLDILRTKITEKTEERAAQVALMEAVLATATDEARADLAPEEEASFTEARDAVDKLDAELASMRAREVELVSIEERARNAANVPQITPPAPDAGQLDARSVSALRGTEVRDRAMRIIESSGDVVSLRSDQKDKLDKLLRTRRADTDGRQIAERMVLTENANYRNAFAKAALGNGNLLTAEESRGLAEFAEWESRAMSSTNTAGGYGVPVLIDPTITLTSQGHVPVILQICRIETITTDTWRGVSSQGISWSYDEEAAEVSDDAPTLAQPTVSVWEQRVNVPYSNRIGMDYPGFVDEISELMMASYLDSAAYYTAVGSGSTQPYGIITALDANTNVEVVVTTDGGIYAQDISKVWTALGERYRDSSTWVMSADFAEEVAAFGTTDQFAFQTSRLGDAVTQTLRGRPVKYTDYFPSYASSTGAANWIVVGDFRNYLWVQRAGMSVEYVPHLFGTSNPGRWTGQRGLVAWARNGGDSINDLGFRLLQNQ